MTLRVDWFGLAEGVAADAAGKVTLVGFAPQFLLIDRYPAIAAPSVVWIIEDDEDPSPLLGAGIRGTFKIEVSNPEGATMFVTTQPVELGAKRWPALPTRLQLIAQFPLQIEKPGAYRIHGELRLPELSEPLEGVRTILIANPADLDENIVIA